MDGGITMSNTISFNVNNIQNQQMNASNTKKQDGSIFVGGQDGKCPLAGNSLIEQRKKMAGKQAMKLISDAFSKNIKSQESIDNLRELKAQRLDELKDINKSMADIESQKEALMKEYGVTEDSDEMKELELLKKYQNNRMGILTGEFTDEEIEKLKSMQGTNRSEFQARYLELNDAYNQYQKDAGQIEDEIRSLSGDIELQKNELNASRDMEKAQDAAESIMDAASKETIGLMIQDAKEHVDETAEEEKEKAEKVKEKEEELQERIDKTKERNEEQKNIIEESAEADKLDQSISVKSQDTSAVSQAQKSIDKILKDNNLISDDIKGIEIDLGF